MLIEIWERLRGYDRWTETTAIVETSDLVNKGSQFRISGTTPVLSSRARIAWTREVGKEPQNLKLTMNRGFISSLAQKQ